MIKHPKKDFLKSTLGNGLSRKPKAFSGPYQTTMINNFTKIAKGFLPLDTFVNRSILDLWQRSECAFEN